ncbi:MAG: RNA 2',3'-cyclic phosphodiesterase [Nitrospirae bacterium]|nr:RNA 2',3'-cyclic phosphodiesterase [Nitrospirota bacterium]
MPANTYIQAGISGVRSFISINLPSDIRSSLYKKASEIKTEIPSLKPVYPDNIHLTLKFLGELKDSEVELIKKSLVFISQKHHGFSLSIKGIGAFPDMRKPSIVWAGIEESEELLSIWPDVENAAAEMGFQKEFRRFSPHLTIGRIKDPDKAIGLAEAILPHKDAFFGSIDVTCFSLMKSQLKPEGPVYSALADFYLQND